MFPHAEKDRQSALIGKTKSPESCHRIDGRPAVCLHSSVVPSRHYLTGGGFGFRVELGGDMMVHWRVEENQHFLFKDIA